MVSPKAELEKILAAGGFEVDAIEEREDADNIILNINTPEHAQFYGRQGRNLEALEHLIRVILWAQKYEGFVHLDLNGMKEAQYEQIRKQTREAAEQVMAGEEQVELPTMSAVYRRIAHMVIRDEFPKLQSESIEQHGWKRVTITKK